MTLDSLSESSLLRLEQYLNSNPYREYSMNKPYFPKTSQPFSLTNRLIPSSNNQSSVLAFHELIDNQKNSLTLDRLAYKLRMKSDLNIDTLRETHIRRRRHRHRHHQHYHPSQQNSIHSNISDTLSSIPPSTKTFTRQPTSITMSTNTMKTLMTDDLNGIEGNAVRVGTLDDLIKQFRRAEFRLVRRPPDYLESSSFISSNISTNDRATTITTKSNQQQHQERTIKQPQALTEYRFNGPTIPTTPTRMYREPSFHQGLIYQYRTRERTNNNNNNNTDLPLLSQRQLNSPESNRHRLNSLIIQERQPTAMSSHDKRIQELREKSLMRTEKQLCVCNKLTIVDPFNNSEQNDSTLPQLQQSQNQQQPSSNYIFPPVRPFGYFTKKSTTTDDTHQLAWSPPPPLRMKKKPGKKITRQKNSLDSLDKLGINETIDDDDSSQILNDTIKSMISLTDIDDDIHAIDLNQTAPPLQNPIEHD